MEYNVIYYTDNYNTFDEWLDIVKNNEETVYPSARIPYDEWVQDYIDNIKDKSVEEVSLLKLFDHNLPAFVVRRFCL